MGHILSDWFPQQIMQCSEKNQATQEKDHQVPNPSPYSLDQQPGKHQETIEQQLATLEGYLCNFSPMETQAKTHSKHKPIQIPFEEVFEPVKHLLMLAFGGFQTPSHQVFGGFWMSRVKTGVESDDFDMFFFNLGETVAFSGRFVGNRQQTLGNFIHAIQHGFIEVSSGTLKLGGFQLAHV